MGLHTDRKRGRVRVIGWEESETFSVVIFLFLALQRCTHLRTCVRLEAPLVPVIVSQSHSKLTTRQWLWNTDFSINIFCSSATAITFYRTRTVRVRYFFR